MGSIVTLTYCSKWNHANGQALFILCMFVSFLLCVLLLLRLLLPLTHRLDHLSLTLFLEHLAFGVERPGRITPSIGPLYIALAFKLVHDLLICLLW